MTASLPSSRRRFLLGGLGLLLLACRRPRATAVARGATVLAFGDSVTFGTGAAPGEDWPHLLAGRTGWRVINAGLPGDTAAAGRTRIVDVLRETRPALVIVEIGGNDFLRRRPAKLVKEDIRAILAAIRQHGATAVLMAVPELSLMAALTRQASDSPIYAELADEEKLPVLANIFSDILSQPSLCADTIHPNAAGYRQMAAQIDGALRQLGFIAV